METSPATSAASASSTGKKKPTPCCSKIGLKRGPWTPEEDEILAGYIRREGEGKWRTLPKRAGLLRCGKSCRLRWMNYLKPSVKRGHIAADEEDLILRLHRLLGNRWSLIAGRIPGRTDNEIKNYWNTHLSKKLISNGIDPTTHKPLNPRQTLSYVTTPHPSPSSEEKPEAACPPSKNTVGSSAAVAEEGIFASDHYDYNMGFLPEEEFSSLMEPVIAGGGELFRCEGSQMEELQCYDKTYYGSSGGNGLPDYESFGSLWEATDANN